MKRFIDFGIVSFIVTRHHHREDHHSSFSILDKIRILDISGSHLINTFLSPVSFSTSNYKTIRIHAMNEAANELGSHALRSLKTVKLREKANFREISLFKQLKAMENVLEM